MIFSQDSYQRAIRFAAEAHGAQKVPGGELPYVVHVASVAMEVFVAATLDAFDADLAVTCALLHDVLEDTRTPEKEIERRFGPRVLQGVRALTKDDRLPREQRMADSLARLQREPREVGLVKLADRITNLQAPPAYWSADKRVAYREEARGILAALGHTCTPLAQRLAERIDAYGALAHI